MIKRWGTLGFALIFAFVIFAFAQEQYSQEESSPQVTSPAKSEAKNPPETATYVGVDKCKTCHPSQYKDYTERKFSKAWQVLKMRGRDKDPDCVKCHVTGYGQPSGFVSEEATPHLRYKQCEACHGPGSIHANNPANTEVMHGMREHANRPNTCTDCHRGVIAHRVSVESLF
jgi:nitrate/TMAO reductase-like tetraheme cytochrome c subunit